MIWLPLLTSSTMRALEAGSYQWMLFMHVLKTTISGRIATSCRLVSVGAVDRHRPLHHSSTSTLLYAGISCWRRSAAPEHQHHYQIVWDFSSFQCCFFVDFSILLRLLADNVESSLLCNLTTIDPRIWSTASSPHRMQHDNPKSVSRYYCRMDRRSRDFWPCMRRPYTKQGTCRRDDGKVAQYPWFCKRIVHGHAQIRDSRIHCSK